MRTNTPINKPTAIDVFSGCGGLTAGLKMAGFNVLGAIEINEKARATYQANHPEVSFLGQDVRAVSAKSVLDTLNIKKGALDLLAGCPPCQGFSAMRRRNNKNIVDDSRNDLIDDFARLSFALKPKFIMMENVPSLINYYKFTEYIEGLKLMGYHVIYEVLNVADFNVAQRRRRLIMLASRITAPLMAKKSNTKYTVRDVIAHLPLAGKSGDLIHDLPEIRTEKIKSLIRAIPKNGGSRKSLPLAMQLNCHKNKSGFNDVYGRMAWDEVSPTLTGGCTNPSKGRFLHPEENRAITLREAALLQSFPSTYQFNPAHGKEAIALMIGNALPPAFIQAHAEAIKGLLCN